MGYSSEKGKGEKKRRGLEVGKWEKEGKATVRLWRGV
jgi:hypothetical protein